MKTTQLKKLIKKYKNNLQRIIYLHCENRIFLTNNQLDKVLKLRGERM